MTPDDLEHRAYLPVPMEREHFGENEFESRPIGQIYTLNDAAYLTEDERETKIRAEFARHGVEVTFEG